MKYYHPRIKASPVIRDAYAKSQSFWHALAACFVLFFVTCQTAQALTLPDNADTTTRETLAAAHEGDVEAMYSIALICLKRDRLGGLNICRLPLVGH